MTHTQPHVEGQSWLLSEVLILQKKQSKNEETNFPWILVQGTTQDE